MKAKFILTALIFLSVLFIGETAVAQSSAPTSAAASVKSEKFLRTELYFGRSKPDGTMVSEAEWSRFLVDVVTPRFPDGFTVLSGKGQYREKSGRIVAEPSEVLILLYARKTREANRLKIEEIRRAYMKQFSQESVLRMDLPQTVKVYF